MSFSVEAYRNTWVSRAVEALDTGDQSRLVELYRDDHYYTRLFAASRIIEDNIPPGNDMNGMELAQVIEGYKALDKSGMLKAPYKYEGHSRVQCDPTFVKKIETNMGAYVRFLETRTKDHKLMEGLWWNVVRWNDRKYSWDGAVASLDIKYGDLQKFRAITLYQFILDIHQIREHMQEWKNDPHGAVKFLIGSTLADGADTLYEKVLADLGHDLDSIRAGERHSDVLERLLARTDALGKELHVNSCRKMGALILCGTGDISIGYNGPPHWEDFTPCLGSFSGCIRTDEIMPNKKRTLDDARTNRPDLRRSICAEQRAVMHAIDRGLPLKDSILFSTEPCNQCAEMFVNAGGRTLIFKEGTFLDHETRQLFSVVSRYRVIDMENGIVCVVI